MKPRSARCSAHGRIEAGEPVNPWQSSTPTGPPSWRNGSAPGWTGTVTSSLLSDRLLASSHAEGPVVLLDPQGSWSGPSCGCSSGRGSRASRTSLGGGGVLACNHLSFSDSIFLPLVVERRVTFLAKSDYFNGRGRQGPAHRGLLQGRRPAPGRPLRRPGLGGGAEHRAEGAQRGRLLGIYPEGTRSPDGRLYRGKTGSPGWRSRARSPSSRSR